MGLGRYREASEDLVQVLKLDGKNGAARSELTNVLTLLKKEKKDEEKSVSKRKKILIQDVDGDEPGKCTPQEPNDSPAKKEETPKTVQKDPPLESNQNKDKTETANSKVSQKENAETKNEEVTSKGSVSTSGPVKYNVKSAYQFLQSWKSVKTKDASEYLKILKQVNLADLPKVLSNKLDGDILKTIFEALNLELKNNGDAKFVYEFLQKLETVDRFSMMLMFLSSGEKQALQKLFEDITKQNNEKIGINTEDLSKMRQRYQV